MIKNIVLDIGDVLIDFHWKRTMEELGCSSEVIACLEETMVNSKWWNELDLNIMPEEEIFNRFRELAPNYVKEIDCFLEHKAEFVTSFPKSRSWIMNLKERGYKVYLLSNYPKSFFEIHARERFDFMDIIDGAVVSYELQCIKPDHRIYEHLFKKYDLKPQECVFIDDRPANVEAARALGMQAIRFRSQPQAIRELDDLLALCFTKEGQECIYDGRVMSVWKDYLQLPDGKHVAYELVKQKGGAAVLPIDNEQNVYLVKQYRNTLNQVNLELPAGCYDYLGEEKLVCAKRELSEELGMTAGNWEYLTEIITDIGVSDEKVAIFFATELEMGKRHLDAEEFIKLVKLPYVKALEMVYAGEIVDAKTVVALLGYQNRE